MGSFYFDESVHRRGGFTIGALVYSESSLDEAVRQAVQSVGLLPGVDEYKSGLRADRHPEQVKLRGNLRRLFGLGSVRLGLVIAPANGQDGFAHDALRLLSKVLANNAFESKSHEAFFDEGIFVPPGRAETMRQSVGVPQSVVLHPAVDSRVVGGVQAADLAAHTMGTMLLEQLGVVTKTVKAGPRSGYDEGMEFELGFELWASLRYAFFQRAFPHASETPLDALYDVASCGLHISDRCSPELRTAAEARFGAVYLGCIH